PPPRRRGTPTPPPTQPLMAPAPPTASIPLARVPCTARAPALPPDVARPAAGQSPTTLAESTRRASSIECPRCRLAAAARTALPPTARRMPPGAPPAHAGEWAPGREP